MEQLIASTAYQPLAGKPAFVLEGLEQDVTVFQPIRTTKTWEPHVMAVLERVVTPQSICFDVGANLGAITLPLSRLAWQGHVHAFEANPNAYELLVRNITLNGLRNVTPVNAAITAHTGDTVEIFSTEAQLGCAHMSERLGRTGTREEVKSLALDDYLGLLHIDFLKIDIEGAEIAALEGARRLIAAHPPVLVIEYNPVPADWFLGQSRRALYDVLTGLYRDIAIIANDGVLEPVTSWEQLDGALAVHTWRDLLCTP